MSVHLSLTFLNIVLGSMYDLCIIKEICRRKKVSMISSCNSRVRRSETYFEQVLEDLSQLSGSKSCIGQGRKILLQTLVLHDTKFQS